MRETPDTLEIPEILNKMVDVVLAYRPKPKSKAAKKRKRKQKVREKERLAGNNSNG